jgi:hypothetical protein
MLLLVGGYEEITTVDKGVRKYRTFVEPRLVRVLETSYQFSSKPVFQFSWDTGKLEVGVLRGA